MNREWVQAIVIALMTIIIYALSFIDYARASDFHWPVGNSTWANPLVGAMQFCERYPQDCAVKDKNQRIKVDDLVRLDLLKVTREVNSEFIYMDDLVHYGVDDWWEYPTVDGKGDCEDFALEKKRRLIAMGYPQSALRLALVRTGKKGPPDHVVLVVFTTNANLVLDIKNGSLLWPSSVPYTFMFVQSSVDPKEWVQW